MSNSQGFQSAKLSNILPKEFCHYFTHVLMLKSVIDPPGDGQVPTSLAVIHHELMFDTILERLWPTVESIVGEELIPTYAYSRLYSNGDILSPHLDRPACEVSVTIQLGRSHHYSWPIYVEDQRYDLAEGDGVLYMGCHANHWREACQGPSDYYSGQLFLHYVRKNGQFAEHASDKRGINFVRNRTSTMEVK